MKANITEPRTLNKSNHRCQDGSRRCILAPVRDKREPQTGGCSSERLFETLLPALTGESERFNPIDNRGAYRPSGGSSLENMEIRRIDRIAWQPCWTVGNRWLSFSTVGRLRRDLYAVADGFIERNRAAHEAGSARSAENQRAHLHQALRAGPDLHGRYAPPCRAALPVWRRFSVPGRAARSSFAPASSTGRPESACIHSREPDAPLRNPPARDLHVASEGIGRG